MGSLRPVCSDPSRFTSTPLYFHIYADNRKELGSFLVRNGVLAWINRSKAKHLGTLDGETEYIFQHILPLPCDQRYTPEDRKHMCDVLQAYELSHRAIDSRADFDRVN